MLGGERGSLATAEQQLERYDRQLRLKGWNQARLQSATVLIVGIGALGCEVSKNLALMGVGELILVDNDVVELSNLSRQMLFTDSDIGKSKSLVAKDRLEAINPHLRVRALNGDVRKFSTEIFEESDVICSCVDNWPTRRWINSLAVELEKPLVDVAMEGFYANVQDVMPGRTACIECHGDTIIPKEVQAAECTLRRRKPEDLVDELKQSGIEITVDEAEGLFRAGIKTAYDIKYTPLTGVADLAEDARALLQRLKEALQPKMPALQSVAATISGLASAEVVKILHQGRLGKPLSGLILYDALSSRVTRVPLKRNEECFVCGKYAKAQKVRLVLKGSETVFQVKEIIAKTYMYPDAELQYKTHILPDDIRMSELMIKTGDTLYVHTSRRAQPFAVEVIIGEDSGRG